MILVAVAIDVYLKANGKKITKVPRIFKMQSRKNQVSSSIK
jgi:hypothetical protein